MKAYIILLALILLAPFIAAQKSNSKNHSTKNSPNNIQLDSVIVKYLKTNNLNVESMNIGKPEPELKIKFLSPMKDQTYNINNDLLLALDVLNIPDKFKNEFFKISGSTDNGANWIPFNNDSINISEKYYVLKNIPDTLFSKNFKLRLSNGSVSKNNFESDKFVLDQPKLKVKFLSPIKNHIFRTGQELIITWDVENLQKKYNNKYVHIGISTDYGENWFNLSKDSIKLSNQIYTINVEDSLASDHVKIKLFDIEKKIMETESDRFMIKKQNITNDLLLSIGGNFSFFDGFKINGIYASVNVTLPDLWKVSNLWILRDRRFGIDLLFYQGIVNTKDSLISTHDSLTTRRQSNTDNRSVLLSSAFFFDLTDYLDLYFLNFEFRQNNLTTNYNLTGYARDTSKNLKPINISSTVSSRVYQYFIGVGPSFKYSNQNFYVRLIPQLQYEIGERGLNYMVRFGLQDAVTRIKFGGEVRGPLFRNSIFKDEVIIYLSKEISLSYLYKAIF